MLPYDKFLSSMHFFWPTSSCRTPPIHPFRQAHKNAMLVTLSSAGVLASAFLSSLQILRPLIRFCYVACSIKCDTKSLYYSTLQTVTSSLSVNVLQCTRTCRYDKIKTQWSIFWNNRVQQALNCKQGTRTLFVATFGFWTFHLYLCLA